MAVTDITTRRVSPWFITGSLLLHLGLALLVVKGQPLMSRTAPRFEEPPLVVTILDPDAVADLLIGPKTHLPPKPFNDVPAPRSRSSASPSSPPAAVEPSDSAASMEPSAPADRAEGLRRAPLPRSPAASARKPRTPESVPGIEEPPAPPPGLPFVNRDEINQMAKLFTPEMEASKEPYAVNTEDLQYLSYIAKIARTLELVWQYPKEAGLRGQQGVTVLKVVIREDGKLSDVQLMQSSGYAMLDGEALRAIKRIAPYPPLPQSWRRSEWGLTISFSYLLTHVSVGVI